MKDDDIHNKMPITLIDNIKLANREHRLQSNQTMKMK